MKSLARKAAFAVTCILTLSSTSLCFAGSFNAASTQAPASSPFYVGAAIGFSESDTPSNSVFVPTPDSYQTVITSSTSETGGIGWRLFAGYDFQRFLSIEAGFTQYAKSNYGMDAQSWDGNTKEGSSSATLSYHSYSAELFLNAHYRFNHCLTGYLALGPAYLSQKVDYSNVGDGPVITPSGIADYDSGSHTTSAIRPAGGMGLAVKLNAHLALSVYAQMVLGRGDISTDTTALADHYFLGVSLSSHF